MMLEQAAVALSSLSCFQSSMVQVHNTPWDDRPEHPHEMVVHRETYLLCETWFCCAGGQTVSVLAQFPDKF